VQRVAVHLHCPVEGFFESTTNRDQRIGNGDIGFQFRRQGADPGVLDATGNDSVVGGQIRITVEGETMGGHALGNADTDRCNLALGPRVGGHPDAAAAGDSAGAAQPEIRARRDQRLLQQPHVRHHVDRIGQLDERVTDQLAGPVPGDAATTIHVDNRRAVGGQITRLSPPARGVDGVMGEQQDRVRTSLVGAGSGQVALPIPGDLVVDQPGLDELQWRRRCSDPPPGGVVFHDRNATPQPRQLIPRKLTASCGEPRPGRVDNSDLGSRIGPTVLGMTFQVGDYQATELVGAGGSAQVWLGRRGGTGPAVAIKVFPAEQLATARREAALAAAVDHPHVVTVLDVVADADRVALITEYAGGGTLAGVLDSRGTLSPGETLTVLLPLAAALATAHERQIVHGDLSARNVLFDRAGRPLLADLGAARAAMELSLPVTATAADAAPELARGGAPTPASDMFSLGSLGLACLTGRHAWPAEDLRDVMIQAAAGQWPDLSDGSAPAALTTAVRALLQHDPERRPGAASLVIDLRAAGRPEPLALIAGPDPVDQLNPAGGLILNPASGPADPVPNPVIEGLAPPTRATRHRHRSLVADPARRPDAGARPGPRIRAIRAWPDSDDLDAERLSRSRATTRVRSDAVPRVDSAPSRRHVLLLRTALMTLGCVLVVGLACGAGLWWAGLDRVDPTLTSSTGPATSDGPVALSVLPRSSGPGVVAHQPQAPRYPSSTTPEAGTSDRASPSPEALTTPLPSTANPTRMPPTATPVASSTQPPGEGPAATVGNSAHRAAARDWTAIVRLLDSTRARALIARDPAILDAVYTPDSAARSTDAGTIANLQAAGLRVSGAQHLVRTARVLGGGPIRLVVEDSLPSYSVIDAAGKVVGRTAARSTASRVLVLVRTADGYRINAVENR